MLTRQPKGDPPHRGSIINIGSLVCFQGGLNVPAYAAAKGGVAQLTKSLSNQWASSGINVNCVSRPQMNIAGDRNLNNHVDRTWVHSYRYERGPNQGRETCRKHFRKDSGRTVGFA